MSITIPRSVLGAAIAACLLLASPAMAKPTADLRTEAPTSSLAGTAAPKQDLRGEHARDASRPPVTPVAQPAASAPKALPAVDGNGSRPDTWLLVAIGLAGAIVIAAGTSGLVRARRTA